MGLGLSLLAVFASPPPAAGHGDPSIGHYDTVDYDICTKPIPSGFHLTAKQQTECANIVIGGEPGDGTKIADLIQRVVSILAWVAGIAAVIVVVVQGLRMVLSGGDASAVSSARNGIIYALAGLAVAASAPHLVGYIVSIL